MARDSKHNNDDHHDDAQRHRNGRTSAATTEAGLPVLNWLAAVSDRRKMSLPERPLSAHRNGRFALMRASSVLSTRAALLNCRLRFAFFAESRWRRADCARRILPRAVILNRFATDLRVLLRAIGLGISGGN
jgi:hypothetical protein